MGLFDLSADAALAYDITHRLLAEVEKIAHKELAGKKVEDLPDKVGKGLPLPLSSVLSSEASRTKRIRTEISKLNELEKNPTLTSPALNWLERNSLDCDAPEVLPAKECERLNFRHPREFYDARQTEAEEKKWSPSENVKKVLSTKTKDKKSIVLCQGMYPLIADLKALIRKEAVRVAKAVILHGRGAPVEGDEAGKKKRRKAEERDPLHRKKRRSNKVSCVRIVLQALLCHSHSNKTFSFVFRRKVKTLPLSQTHHPKMNQLAFLPFRHSLHWEILQMVI